MRPIHDAHVEQPGLAVVEVAAADDVTVFAVQDLLAANYTVAPGERAVREPGESCVRETRDPNPSQGLLDCRTEMDKTLTK
ncbi:DUF6207 family protein [Streptomyces canus]|uniref:DUF6207 family protein n=1 Tax=Streptomyces canus TaxID=58343 RepID=UPI0003A25F66|nr:DUF6207 family protein [Streptomyces canus]